VKKPEEYSPRIETSNKPTSMKFDATGSPRVQPVRVPDYLTMSSRKNAFPNHQVSFLVYSLVANVN